MLLCQQRDDAVPGPRSFEIETQMDRRSRLGLAHLQEIPEIGNMVRKFIASEFAIGDPTQPAAQLAVVIENECTVSRSPDIAFETCGAESQCQRERLHRVLRRMGARPAMGEGHRWVDERGEALLHQVVTVDSP